MRTKRLLRRLSFGQSPNRPALAICVNAVVRFYFRYLPFFGGGGGGGITRAGIFRSGFGAGLGFGIGFGAGFFAILSSYNFKRKN